MTSHGSDCDVERDLGRDAGAHEHVAERHRADELPFHRSCSTGGGGLAEQGAEAGEPVAFEVGVDRGSRIDLGGVDGERSVLAERHPSDPEYGLGDHPFGGAAPRQGRQGRQLGKVFEHECSRLLGVTMRQAADRGCRSCGYLELDSNHLPSPVRPDESGSSLDLPARRPATTTLASRLPVRQVLPSGPLGAQRN